MDQTEPTEPDPNPDPGRARPPWRPAYADRLDESLAEAWRMLARGAADRRSPFHTPVLATRGLDDRPEARTVVLRATDSEARTLRFHTDHRSAKVAELARDPRACLLFYDAGHKLQLRVTGRAALHHQDDIAATAWAASRPFSRACYAQPIAPGEATSEPIEAPRQDHEADGYDRFVAVLLRIDAIEWLWLDHAGHRRARFAWDERATLHSTWLAP